MQRIRIGVIGLRFGRHLVRTLANMHNAELTAIADRSADLPGGLDGYAEHYGARAYRHGEELIEREDLDAICIATAPGAREALVTAAARKGLPMFVEKPWAPDLETAHRLAAICREHNAKVMVAFSFRFHPAITKLRSLMDGELGEGWLLNGEYIFNLNPPAGGWLWNPQSGNGIFNENSGHLFDAVCYLLGKPVALTAEAINPLSTPSEHAAAVTVRFASDAVAALTIGGIGANAHRDFPRIDIITANGQARLGGREHMWERLTWAIRQDEAVHTLVQSPEALGNTRYTHAFTHFLDCVAQGKQPSVGVEDGITAVALAMAVYESARTGKKVEIGD